MKIMVQVTIMDKKVHEEKLDPPHMNGVFGVYEKMRTEYGQWATIVITFYPYT